MSGQKRRTTVHDLANLRLHPDGSRVANSESNLQPSTAKYVTKDARGNWIARDAGGTGRVLTRQAAKRAQEQSGEAGLNGPESGASGGGKGRGSFEGLDGGEKNLKDSRAKKKRAFASDLSFLGPANITPPPLPISAPAVEISTPREPASPQPSSDLLKCIHHYASTYYTEMGQLRDSSREYRQDKKRRKLEAQNVNTGPLTARSREGEPEANWQEENSDSASTSLNAESSQQRGERRGKSDPKVLRSGFAKGQESNTTTDMYKVCDGSALMAIGMLLEQHVADLLSPRPPKGWEDAMIGHGEIPLCNDVGDLTSVDDEEEASYGSGRSEDETAGPDLITLVNHGHGDEEYVPN